MRLCYNMGASVTSIPLQRNTCNVQGGMCRPEHACPVIVMQRNTAEFIRRQGGNAMSGSSKYGSAPEFRYIKDETRQAALVALRAAVAPILDNNILTHFTDHSVFHSDSLTHIVSHLIGPLQRGKQPLTDQELTTLYAACYLHDIGMHNEMAGDTTVMQRAIADHGYKQTWNELQPKTQTELIRALHHQVSAEMIGQSVRAGVPMVGIQLTDVYDPGRVAAVCEAHCTPFGSDRYSELTKEGPEMRMSLLAGLLRVADILDETRPRAERAKARILNLDLESKIHWWRHYYTECVTIDSDQRLITLWFDFPPDRLNEYSRVIPQLQKPWIEVELSNQASVFGAYGLNWNLTSTVAAKEYGGAETMPDDVFAAMLKELSRRRTRQAEEQRMAVLEHFAEAQPLIKRRLDELNARKESMQPGDFLRAVRQVADNMWDLGARRSAWHTLWPAYTQNNSELAPQERVEMGIRLARMMQEDKSADMAARVLYDLTPVAEALDDSATKYAYWELRARCWFENCDAETPAAIAAATRHAPDEGSRQLLLALLAEWYLLQTELTKALASAEKESGSE